MSINKNWIQPIVFIIFSCAGWNSAIAQSNYEAPRTIDGHPDLQGVWGNNTVTPVERPDIFEGREFLTAEEMQLITTRAGEIVSETDDALFGESVITAALTGNSNSNDPSTGNYDQFWLAERSVHNRTSQIIDPPNGKYPPLTKEGIARRNMMAQLRNNSAAAGERFETLDSYDTLSLDDRCISSGVPYLDPGYNSYWQIVQSRDYVVIVQEMMHNVRIIPMTGMPHAPENIELWHGDSRGYWDGDTLVIETRNFSDRSEYSHNRAELNIERLTRIGETAMRYQITSNDPGTYTSPYTREMIFDSTDGDIFEFACHEGNYALANMLRGAREAERREKENQSADKDN